MEQLKKDANIKELNESSLDDLKASAERTGATCTIS